ncbi:MAG: hypothetical protein V1495_06890 [Pseudomonadota bacterium]
MWVKRIFVFSMVLGLGIGWAYAGSIDRTKKLCGLVGMDDERINDCSQKNEEEDATRIGKSKFRWKLLTRTISKSGDVLSFYKDKASGKVWTDPLSMDSKDDKTWEDAKKACSTYHPDHSKTGTTMGDGFPRTAFELPSAEDYKLAEDHGIRDALEDTMKDQEGDSRWWWTSSPYVDLAEHFRGSHGGISPYPRAYPYAVRCAAR